MDAGWWIDALRAPPGRALLDELSHEPPTPANELRLATRLRREYPPELVTAALTQAKLRIRARAKFTRADSMFFTQAGLEQASSERMAAAHAARYEPYDLVMDLCTGVGGDLMSLATGRDAIGVDKDSIHARVATVNAEINGVASSAAVVCADVESLRLGDVRAAFIDPARRSSGERFRAGTSEPSLSWCFGLAEQGTALGIKAAPGLPTDLVPADWELEFVSERGDLKESVLWSPALRTAVRRATLLGTGNAQPLTLVAGDGAQLQIRLPGAYLLDPDPAVTRAGLVEELGVSLGEVWKIDEQIGFLSADFPMMTPFGRALRIEASMPWSLARLRESLRGLDVGVVDIRKRGSAVDVDELQRKLKLTGSRAATVALTRASGRPWALVCSPVLT